MVLSTVHIMSSRVPSSHSTNPGNTGAGDANFHCRPGSWHTQTHQNVLQLKSQDLFILGIIVLCNSRGRTWQIVLNSCCWIQEFVIKIPKYYNTLWVKRKKEKWGCSMSVTWYYLSFYCSRQSWVWLLLANTLVTTLPNKTTFFAIVWCY